MAKSRKSRKSRIPRFKGLNTAKKRAQNTAGAQFKLKSVGAETSDLSGVVTQDILASGLTAAVGYASLGDLYDSYVVKGIKIKMLPVNVGEESASTGLIRGNIARIVDMDGTGLPTNMSAMLAYDSFKLIPARETNVVYAYIPKKYRPSLNDFLTGFNSDNKDTTIRYYGDNFSASDTQYWFVKTWYITCYGRR